MRCRILLIALCLTGAAYSSPVGEDTKTIEPEPTSTIPELDLPLPVWDSDEYRKIDTGLRQMNLGGGLWPSEQIQIFPNVDEEIIPLSPGSLVIPAGQGTLLSYALFNQYFADRPAAYLADPQNLLARPFRENVERFLTYHSSESKITTYVLVFKKGQEFPIELSTRAIWRRWFPEGEGAIVFYYMGEPEATAIELGQAFAESAGNERLESLLNTCVSDALESPFPGGQLERFCVKYSVQTYQLEKNIAQEARATMATVGLDEKEDIEVPPAKAILPVVLAALGAIGTLLIWWIRGRRPVYFPEFDEIPVRLGGEYTGGTDAVVSFSRGG